MMEKVESGLMVRMGIREKVQSTKYKACLPEMELPKEQHNAQSGRYKGKSKKPAFLKIRIIKIKDKSLPD